MSAFFGGKTLILAAGIIVIIVLAIVWLPSHVPPSARLVASANPDKGKQLYTQYCVSCHGVNGQGEFNWRSRERAAPALDSSGHAWHHEDSQLISMILDKPLPDSHMPRWHGVLSENDAVDLLAYIKTLWTPYIRENCSAVNIIILMLVSDLAFALKGRL